MPELSPKSAPAKKKSGSVSAPLRSVLGHQVMKLTEETEEVATFYGKMLDHDYTTKEVFNKNFFKDWRKVMSEKEKEIIRYKFGT